MAEHDHPMAQHDQAPRQAHDHPDRHGGIGWNYGMLAVNVLLGLAVMYLGMFTMIDGWHDFRQNINMAYMALTMAAPMGIIMLATMSRMYPRRGLNTVLCLGFALLCIAALAATRAQTLVGDRQFIASMIPHHSGAILMCRQNRLTDQELIRLCDEIVRSQQREIEQMNRIRSRLDGQAAAQR